MLTPEEILKYSKLTPDELWHLEDKHDLDVDTIYGIGTTVTQAKLARCFILDWERGGGPMTINRIPEDDSMRSLMPMVVNLDPARKQTSLSHGVENELNEITKRIICYRVSGAVDIAGLAWQLANITSTTDKLPPVTGEADKYRGNETNQ